ncbi:putative Oligosaccharyl transferase STT3 subunit [uncultured Desulfatiglans sp.]|uniref:Putative Oligosaccharyl transferase STT3 subunit n=1 Tax=Uncultured Desulfatiglans sp. TaxID=1748965 RepID=A0A653A874_UNCDX|nr:putative Oligosaccharyl transferase STT3 subunit [uncultured Desulfatiglans sp.]
MKPEANPFICRHRDWILPLILVFLLCTGIRLIDLIHWDSPDLFIDGQRVMATHDAYAWLAGAERVNQYSCHPMAILLRFLHAATGLGVANLAFWLPVFMAPMAALPIVLLGLWWRLPVGTVLAGTLCTVSSGYLIRSRLGFYDTDPLALFFAVGLGAALVCWLEPVLRLPRKSDAAPSPRRFFGFAFLIGIWGRLYFFTYPSGEPISLTIFAVAAFVGCIFGMTGLRVLILTGLLIAFLAGNAGWISFVLAGGATLLAFLHPGIYQQGKRAILPFLILLTALLLFSGLSERIGTAIWHLVRYGDRSATGASINYPATLSTVIEARTIEWHSLQRALAGNGVLFFLGIIAYAYLCVRRPAALVFAPMLFLAVAATKLGARFSMYGSVAIGLGLGFGLTLLSSSRRWATRLNLPLQFLLLAAALWHPAHLIHNQKPFFFISKAFGEALVEMRSRVSSDAQFWVWWDFGYACQFYSRVSTFADGSRNSGEYVLPLARVHATHSPEEAGALIRFIAQEQSLMGNPRHPCADRPVYPNPTAEILDKMRPGEAKIFFDGIQDLAFSGKASIPEQYLVLAWENIRISLAIRRFGTWDIVSGQTENPNLMVPTGRIALRTSEGTIDASGKRFKTRTLDVLSKENNRHYEYPWNRGGWHVFSDLNTQTITLMDDGIYHSMMVQMLIGKPESFAPYFDLVLDRSPSVRIYRLNPWPSS